MVEEIAVGGELGERVNSSLGGGLAGTAVGDTESTGHIGTAKVDGIDGYRLAGQA